jgi:limonene-1,2-epoxide hydrolase
MIERAEAVAVFERRRDAWLREDADAYLACFTDGIVLRTPTVEVAGIDAYRAVVRRSLAALRPVSFDFHHIAVDGTSVLAEWTIALDVRASGDRITYRGMSVCELRDGLIASWREFYDPSDLKPARLPEQ